MSKRKLPEINKKIFPYDLVIAWWEDIVADSIWLDIPDIKKSTTAICCTVGWLMKQDEKVTILMSDFNFESNNPIILAQVFVKANNEDLLKSESGFSIGELVSPNDPSEMMKGFWNLDNILMASSP